MPAQPSSPKRILLAPAAGPGVGGGHVMRCLTLAEALAARGAVCAFSVNAAGEALMSRFSEGRFAVHPGEVSHVLATAPFDVLVWDDYAVGIAAEQRLRGSAGKTAVIDDLADRLHEADLLLDPGYGRCADDYEALLPPSCLKLIGPRYALVKPAFSTRRAEALARPVAAELRRVFVSFGLSDIDGIAARAAEMIRGRWPDAHIDIALAADAESACALRARAEVDPALHLHFDAANMAALMAPADAAIGGGGVSTWERACLGLPTLAVIVADNQRAMIEALAADGALLAADLSEPAFDQRFRHALERLSAPALRQALRSASAALCDGLGADRVAEAILAL